jgi:hypothetical protein
MEQSKPYLERSLIIKKNGDIYDEYNIPVMMGWEKPLMEESGKIICSNGGDILNIGYGMGLIDNVIETQKINSHWIIEAHPEIQKIMLQQGWLKKSHVKSIFGTWQDICPYLPEFDGIYFDTYSEDTIEFFEKIHHIVKPKGIFSFFYSPNHTTLGNWMIDILSKNFNIEYKNFSFKNIPQMQGSATYWEHNLQDCKIPICRLK